LYEATRVAKHGGDHAGALPCVAVMRERIPAPFQSVCTTSQRGFIAPARSSQILW